MSDCILDHYIHYRVEFGTYEETHEYAPANKNHDRKVTRIHIPRAHYKIPGWLKFNHPKNSTKNHQEANIPTTHATICDKTSG